MLHVGLIIENWTHNNEDCITSHYTKSQLNCWKKIKHVTPVG